MDFSFSEIQSEFRSNLRRFLTERGAHSGKAEPREMARRWRGPLWTALAELGTFAALLPEAFDGLGGDSIDALAILDEIGRAGASPPVIETAVIAAGLLDRLGTAAQKEPMLPAIAAGALKFAFADGDILAPGNTEPSFKLTMRDDGRTRLEGRQDVVAEAPDCDHLLILCGGPGPGLTLFCLKPDHPGIQLRLFWTMDDRPAARVTLEGVALDASARIGGIGAADEAVTDMLDLAVVAQCAEACGVMASLLNQTIAHLKTRTQFGQPLANFQALQHRLVDMYAAYELSLSLTYKAAILCKRPGTPERRAAVSGAKVQAADAARLIGHEAIQMHGAMGMSLELPVGRAVKRLKAMEPQFGSSAYHLRRYRALSRGRAA
jgi:alkylation response protein AidB-like acyl-CoA dehydrogenase